MSVINGLIAALTTPFTNDGIDVKALQQHIMALYADVNGFALGGTTGESLSLTDEELVTLLQASSAVVGDKLLIAGFWRPTVQEALNTAKYVVEFADVLLIPIPKELVQESDASIADFYAQIAKITVKPILLYNFPEHCEGRAISPQLAATIAQNNINIIGVKDSSKDVSLIKAIIKNNLPLQPILGNDRFLVEVLQLLQEHKCSYEAASISGACSVPHIARQEVEMYSLCAVKDYSQAKVLETELLNQYFKSWSIQAPQFGGKAPIIKHLIAADLSGYPTMVRAPLKEFIDPGDTEH